MLKRFSSIDWIMLLAVLPLTAAGLSVMYTFTGESILFEKQVLWIIIGLVVFFACSTIEFRFLRRTSVIMSCYAFVLTLLLLLFVLGHVSKGAQSWFRIGFAAFQPTDLVKIVVIALLAKYFSRRHVEIADFRHILISGIYAVIPFVLVLLQPDFGSAMVIFFIWFGMTIASGISKKHLALVGCIGLITFGLMWQFAFHPYQKARISNFFNPLADVRGTGYNVYQSVIAIGSGQVLGKGVGFGTQSRLQFLPEHETDFIFAGFAEEWGFVGVVIVILLCLTIVLRILYIASLGASNFETLFAVGVAIYFVTHMAINIGMNMGIMPVTGIPLPFMSYGGSHIVAEFLALGILMGMRRYSRIAHRDNMKNEFLGLE